VPLKPSFKATVRFLQLVGVYPQRCDRTPDGLERPKERLGVFSAFRGQKRRMNPAAGSSGQARRPAAVLPNHLNGSLGERTVRAQRHHVRNAVDIDGLEGVILFSDDIAKFEGVGGLC